MMICLYLNIQKNQKILIILVLFNKYSMNSNKSKSSCCNLEAVVSFDERGQLVMPKEIRKKFNLQAGDKFAIISCSNGDELCCLSFVKANALNETMADFLGPAVTGNFQ